MSVVIDDLFLETARMNEEELRQEIALLLFQKEKLTLEQAGHFAQMNQLQFQHLLASRKIPLHYGLADFEEDVKVLAQRKSP